MNAEKRLKARNLRKSFFDRAPLLAIVAVFGFLLYAVANFIAMLVAVYW